MPSLSIVRSQRLRQANFQGDALRLGMNWTEEDLGKPQVLVDSAYGMGHPGTFHFRPLIEEVSNGVFEAGGKPGVFTVSDICDGVAQAHERVAREIGEHLSRVGSVIGDQPALPLHRGMQRGDIGEPDDRFWRSRQRIVIDARKDAHQAVAPAQNPDRIDFRIANCAIDVVQSIAIVTGQIPAAVSRVCSDDRLPAE